MEKVREVSACYSTHSPGASVITTPYSHACHHRLFHTFGHLILSLSLSLNEYVYLENIHTNSQQRMNALRLETDQAHAKNEELSTRVKTLEQENLTKEQEILSLTHQKTLLEGEVDKLEKALAEAKSAADTGAAHGSEVDALSRKLQLLEEEAEEADKNLRETNEKQVSLILFPHDQREIHPFQKAFAEMYLTRRIRLRLTDVKAEHYERKVATVEAERDSWERKYEETCEKLKASQEELEAISKQLDDL